MDNQGRHRAPPNGDLMSRKIFSRVINSKFNTSPSFLALTFSQITAPSSAENGFLLKRFPAARLLSAKRKYNED